MKDKKKIREKKRPKWYLRITPLTIMIVIAGGFLAYANTFQSSFHWDDFPQVVNNDRVHDLSNFADPAIWSKINLRPMAIFTFAINYSIGADNIAGYHLVNILLHILTALMVFFLVRYTLSLPAMENRFDKRSGGIAAAFAALLFLLHPVQTMAVTYIVQRMTIMAALFYISAVYLYARGRILYLNKGLTFRSGGLIALSVIIGIFGVLSKQNAVTFPAAFLLFELFFIRREDGSLCRRYLLSATGVMVILFLAVALMGKLPAETSQFTRLEYLSTQFGIVHKYLLLLLFPVSQNVDYFVMVQPPLIGAREIVGLLLLALLLLSAVYFFRKNKLISFGILWFLLSMSVESSLIPIKDIMMEHRLYLPIVGFGLFITGLAVEFIPKKNHSGAALVAALILVVLAVATYNRNKVWDSELSLWKDSLEKNDKNPRAMNNYGFAIKVNAENAPSPEQRARDLRTAIQYFSNSMVGDTVFTMAYLNRGLSWFELGDYDKAIEDINVVVDRKPDELYLKYYIEGVAAAKQGNLEIAGDNLDQAVELKDDFAAIYTWRGLVSSEREQYQKALKSFLRSIQLDPGQTILYINISNMYYYLQDYRNALSWLKRANNAGEAIDREFLKKLDELVNGKVIN